MRLKILSAVAYERLWGSSVAAIIPSRSRYLQKPRKKDEEAERIRRLEAFVLQSEEREKAHEEWMQAEIQRQVQAALSQMTKGQGTSHPEVNVSPQAS